ncbi:MAG TPA: YihY/virulence factor BrkB family protein [Chthonomonadaceae bacterium]|nr:YihY/virulence factor BrkB family protein [Chthonomonadaceae bacterium]
MAVDAARRARFWEHGGQNGVYSAKGFGQFACCDGRRTEVQTEMNRQAVAPGPVERPDWKETRETIRDSIDEIRQAVTIRDHHKGFLREAISWTLAAAAGAAILARSFKAASAPAEAEKRPRTETRPAIEAQKRPAESADSDGAGAAVAERPAPESAAKAPEAPAEAAQPAAKHGRLQGFVELVKELAKRYSDDDNSTRAAALAFWGILSLVPILLLALAVLGFLVSPQQAAEYMRNVVAQWLPGTQAANTANQVIQETHIAQSAQGLMQGRILAVVFGVLSLLWTSISFFVTAAAPMNAAWDVKETRSFIKLRLVCLGVFLGTVILFLLSLLPSAGPNFVRNLHIPWLGLPKHIPFWIDALFELVAVAIDVAMFTLIYKFLPNAPVSWGAALCGGTITGVLFEIFKKGFAVYLTHFGNYNKLYGTFGGLVALVMWAYYSGIVLLIGAEISKMYQEHRHEGGVKPKPRRTPPGKPVRA